MFRLFLCFVDVCVGAGVGGGGGGGGGGGCWRVPSVVLSTNSHAINAVWTVVVLHCERMDLWSKKRRSLQQQSCQYYQSDALSIAGIIPRC